MTALLTAAFCFLGSACGRATEYAAMPGQKANAIAKADHALAESRQFFVEFQARSKYLDGMVEQIVEEKRAAESRKADVQARDERSVRRGQESRQAAKDRCTRADSRVR